MDSFCALGSCRAQYTEAFEATIVLTLSSHHKGFSSLPWPGKSQKAAENVESASVLSVSGRHRDLSPKGWPVVLVVTDKGDGTRAKDALAVSWRRGLKTQFLLRSNRVCPFFLRGSSPSMSQKDTYGTESSP